MPGRSASREEIENNIALLGICRNLKHAPYEPGRFDGIQHVFVMLEVHQLQQLLFCFLCVANLLVGPESLWHNPLFYFGEKPFEPWHIVPIWAPPDTVVAIEFLELLVRNTPIGSSRTAVF